MHRIVIGAILFPGIITAREFKVATVNRVHSAGFCSVQFPSDDQFIVKTCTLSTILRDVYGLSNYRIMSAPGWTSDRRFSFDIRAQSAGPESVEQRRDMAKVLLETRFHLKTHRETREIGVYLLIPTDDGVHLAPPSDVGLPPGVHGTMQVGPGVMIGNNVTMNQLIQGLWPYVDRLILDRTNVSEKFNYRLDFAPPSSVQDRRSPLLVAIQEELGLRLDPQRVAMDVLVIDHVEKSSTR